MSIAEEQKSSSVIKKAGGFSIDNLLGGGDEEEDYLEVDDDQEGEEEEEDLEIAEAEEEERPVSLIKPTPLSPPTTASEGGTAGLLADSLLETRMSPTPDASGLFLAGPTHQMMYSQWLATRNTSLLFGLQGETRDEIVYWKK